MVGIDCVASDGAIGAFYKFDMFYFGHDWPFPLFLGMHSIFLTINI